MDRDYYYSPAPRNYGYRTMCVRLCDGFYWPISNATGRSRFRSDAQQCESSCESPAKLFYSRGIATPAEQMIDLQGKPYSALPNAFRYREKYMPECRCKPDPWSEEAKADYAKRADMAEADAAGKKVADVQPANAVPANVYPKPYYPPRRRRKRDTGSDLFFGRWFAHSW